MKSKLTTKVINGALIALGVVATFRAVDSFVEAQLIHDAPYHFYRTVPISAEDSISVDYFKISGRDYVEFLDSDGNVIGIYRDRNSIRSLEILSASGNGFLYFDVGYEKDFLFEGEYVAGFDIDPVGAEYIGVVGAIQTR